MPDTDDHQLLASYARGNSEAAFSVLVQRYVGFVYSVALRCAGDAHAAEEITQAVFIILAQKAGRLSDRTVLAGWLHQTARWTAANYLRGEWRRQKREQEAYMQSTLNQADTEAEVWPQLAPRLDEALGRLGERDRNAIVLRYFENKSLREVGEAIGAGEDAAKMRVNRALEKLRKIFARQGTAFSVVAIAGAIAANSVQAAPAGLTDSISAVAVTKGATAGSSTLALVKGALKLMIWNKMKSAIITGAAIILAAGIITVAAAETSAKHSTTDGLEGTWTGKEVGTPGPASPTITFKAGTIEFHGAIPQEWYRATYTVREDTSPKRLIATITACPMPQYAGKVGNAIYQIQDGQLTLSGNEPGDPSFPANFDAPGARKFIFTKK